MFRAYKEILQQFPKVIAFGFFCTFFSNFGQSFFIGLYGNTFQQAWQLSSTEFGFLYSSVTIVSAAILLSTGFLVDVVPLRRYAAFVVLSLALGCVLMAWSPHLSIFVAGLFLMRFNGQGQMGHMSSTVVAREVERGRGRALGLAVLGLPLGSMLFPPLFTFISPLLLWREAWVLYAVIYVCLALPVLLWCAPATPLSAFQDSTGMEGGRKYLRRVLSDPALWLVFIANVFMPFVLTGIFFHQQKLVEGMGFSIALYAMSFTAYGVGHAMTELLSGYVVDKIGPVWVIRLFLIPFALFGCLLVIFPYPWMLPLFMMACAITGGATSASRSAFVAERYGTGRLGALKSLFTAGMVLSSALSPFIFGVLLDAGIASTVIFQLCAISAGLVALLMQALARLQTFEFAPAR